MADNNLEHLGIIMDGNGRWASKRHLPRTAGHLEGLKALKRCILGSIEMDIKFLSLYAFSTENWSRPKTEVNYLMNLIATKLPGELKFYMSKGIRILIRGRKENLPQNVSEAITKVEDATKENSIITVIICFNYGGQSEIADAINKIIEKKITTLITPELIRENIQFPFLPPVDMIVRSAGEKRLSNFLLWESAYSELGFYDKLFPDWNEDFIKEIIIEFLTRTRKFGGLGK
ncbi:MAG: di-trans,poly-cis-decaprenylcistransferase [Spirochaetaceae bacterium]|nr:di-trans,poly-cis-decaprenylcistransferase [Spirochaetaceae bacterium]